MALKALVVDDEKLIVKGLRFSLMQDNYKIMGLDYGADDYITKPFNVLEVKARIKAILRRTSFRKKQSEDQSVISSGDLTMDRENRRVTVSGREINLTSKEFELLELLATNPGKVYGRTKLLETVWGRDYFGELKIVDVNVRRLRLKIEDNVQNPVYITTVWGYGYKWGF